MIKLLKYRYLAVILFTCSLFMVGKAQNADFSIGSASNITTTTVTIPVTALTFNNIVGWQGSINWDNSKMKYLGVSSVNANLNGIQFSSSVLSTSGRLSFIWIDPSLNPLVLGNNTLLFNIRFSITSGSMGSSLVSFANNPTLLQVSDKLGNLVNTVSYTNGTVSFPSTVISPEFSIQSVKNLSANTFSLAVTTRHFIQLMGMQGSIHWDSSIYNLTATSNIHPKLKGIQFNNNTTGNISYLWIDSAIATQTIPDDDTLFKLNFNIVGQKTGYSFVQFSGVPVLQQVMDASANSMNSVLYHNGTVSFPGAYTPPTFYIGSVPATVSTGSFSLPITARNFSNIAAFQGSINWNSDKYSFINVTGIHSKLSGLLLNNTNSGSNGQLSYLWADPSSTLQTIADDSVLFIINFNRVCNATGQNDIVFTGNPTALFVANNDSTLGNVGYYNGVINLASNVTPEIIITPTSNYICTNSSNSYLATVTNGGTIPLLQWKKNGVDISLANSTSLSVNNLLSSDIISCSLQSNAACVDVNSVISNLVSLNYIAPVFDTVKLNGCSSIVYNGVTYTSSVNRQDTFKSSSNCDSVYRTMAISINNIKIEGNIIHPSKGNVIPNVFVRLTGGINDSINTKGSYSFSCLTPNTNSTIRLSKNNDITKSNGVSTIDAALIQSHILQKSVLNNPYKIIAADVNGDGKVSALDIVFIKRLILGLDTTFTNTSSKEKRLWTFIDSSYAFAVPTNPFPLKDSISYTGLSASKTNQTFIGMKLGDVNWDWNPAVAKPNNNTVNAVELSYSSEISPSDGYIRISVKVKNFKEMMGMQFTLGFNAEVMTFKGIENNKLNLEIGDNHILEGKLSMLWLDPKNEVRTLEDGSVAFELVFKITGKEAIGKEAIGIQNTISLDGSITSIEAFDKDYQLHGLVMKRVENIQYLQQEGWVVAPNPTVDGVIHVQMNLKENKSIVFRLLDINGKVLLSKKVEGVKGGNSFTLNQESHLSEGIYYLQAVGVEGEDVKRVMVK